MDWPDLIGAHREIDIETSRGPDARVHHTTIWAVAQDGEVFVRSQRGEAGRWYQELIHNPVAVVHVDGEAIPVRAVQTPDAESIERASTGLRRKYADSRSLQSMLADDILQTTIRLDPR
jgi:hypothetical protein